MAIFEFYKNLENKKLILKFFYNIFFLFAESMYTKRF